MTKEQAAAALLAAVYDTVAAESPDGAPTGSMYAAMIPLVSLTTFNQVLGALVGSGLITISGHVAHTTDKPFPTVTRDLAATLAR